MMAQGASKGGLVGHGFANLSVSIFVYSYFSFGLMRVFMFLIYTTLVTGLS